MNAPGYASWHYREGLTGRSNGAASRRSRLSASIWSS